jgi:SAM-dependent methyltransferase
MPSILAEPLAPAPRSEQSSLAVSDAAARRRCRFCDAGLSHVFVDLGMSPLCESYLTADQLDQMEPFYPLCVYVCERCLLTQLPEYVTAADIFSEYAYFSSYSDSWLHHARRYVEEAIGRFQLGSHSHVVEIASNDGYLLQYFVARGIPALGIEPAANVAQAAIGRGVPTIVKFFGAETARELVANGTRADLLVANNVLAHVPRLNDFVSGIKLLLAPAGVATLEFPHLARLIDENQFDTIYHEHFCYFSLGTARAVLAAHGLEVFDVDELSTHGGSLRVFARHADQGGLVAPAVSQVAAAEARAGLDSLAGHLAFADRVAEVKHRLLEFLIAARREGQTVVGYGAPGKGNTLLNYCGVRTDLLDYTVDRNPYKQGKYLPGTHIPIYPPERIAETRPDYVLVLPWNLREEIVSQLAYIREWGGRCVVPIPELAILTSGES